MSFDSSRVRGICFDVDGTLSDTDDLFVHKLNNLLKPLRFIFPNRDSLSIARRVIMATENPATYLHGLSDRFGIDEIAAKLGGYFYRITFLTHFWCWRDAG
jgi:phosphoglycolate phosphatase-like HAD superfamily hydrolase